MWPGCGKDNREEVPIYRLQNGIDRVNDTEAYNLGGFGLDTYFNFSSHYEHSPEQEKHFSREKQGEGGYAFKLDGQETEKREPKETELETRETEETAETEGDAIELRQTVSRLLVSVTMHNNELDKTSYLTAIPNVADASDDCLISTNGNAKMGDDRDASDSLGESSRDFIGFGRFKNTTISAQTGGERDTIDQYIKGEGDTPILPNEESSACSKSSRFRRFGSATTNAKNGGQRKTIDQHMKTNGGTPMAPNEESSYGSKSARFRRFSAFPRSLKSNIKPTKPVVSNDGFRSTTISTKSGGERDTIDQHIKNKGVTSGPHNDESSCCSKKSKFGRFKRTATTTTLDQQNNGDTPVSPNNECSYSSQNTRFRRFSNFPRIPKRNVKTTVPVVSADDCLKDTAITAKIEEGGANDHCEKNRDTSELLNGESSWGSKRSSGITPISSSLRSASDLPLKESHRSTTTNRIDNSSKNLISDVKRWAPDVSDVLLGNTMTTANMGGERDAIVQFKKNHNTSGSRDNESYRGSRIEKISSSGSWKSTLLEINSKQTQNSENTDADCRKGGDAASNSLGVSQNDGNDQYHVNHTNIQTFEEDASYCEDEESGFELNFKVAPGYDDISTIAETISTYGQRIRMDSSSYQKCLLQDTTTYVHNQLAERIQSLAEWRKRLLDMTRHEDMKLQAVTPTNEKDETLDSSLSLSRSPSQEISSKLSGNMVHTVHKNAIRSVNEAISDGPSVQSDKEDKSRVTSIEITKHAEPSVLSASHKESSLNSIILGTDMPVGASIQNDDKSSNRSSRKILLENFNSDLEPDQKRREANQNTIFSSDSAISTITTHRTFDTAEQKVENRRANFWLLNLKQVKQSEMEKASLSFDTWSVADKEGPRDDTVADMISISKATVPLAEGGNDKEKEVSAYNEDNYQPEAMIASQENQQQEEPLSKQLDLIVQRLREYQEMQKAMMQQISKSRA